MKVIKNIIKIYNNKSEVESTAAMWKAGIKIPVKSWVELSYPTSPFSRRMWLARNLNCSKRFLTRQNESVIDVNTVVSVAGGEVNWLFTSCPALQLSFSNRSPGNPKHSLFYFFPCHPHLHLRYLGVPLAGGDFQKAKFHFSTLQLCFQQIFGANVLFQLHNQPTFAMWEVGGQS